MLQFLKKHVFYVLSGIWIIIFLISFTGSFLYFSVSRVFVPKSSPSPTPQNIIPNLSATPTPETGINILLIGYGGGSHSGGNLSDSLLLAHLDPIQKKIFLISVPRDTWIPLQISESQTENQKINAAYAIGGDDRKYPTKPDRFKGISGSGEMAKDAVARVLGIPVHYFAAVDFSGFIESIDTLGGIEVNVPVTFNDYYYPIKGKEEETCGKTPEEMTAIHATLSGYSLEQQFTCRYEHLYFQKGINIMSGETALKFVRSRHSTEHGSDFARSERQKEVLIAIKNKAISLGALDNLFSFTNQFTRSVKTDMNLDDMNSALKKIGNIRDYSVTQIILNTDNVFDQSTSRGGAYILVPKAGSDNFEEIHKFIQEQTHAPDQTQ